jgi:hypothetical protein
MILLSKAELAEELGVSSARVSQLIGEGLPCRHDGRCDLKAVCEWLCDRGDYQGSVAYRRARDWLLTLNYEPRRSTSKDAGK